MYRVKLINIIYAICVIVFFVLWYAAPSGECAAERSDVKKFYKGMVIDKFIDRKNHLNPTLKISNYNTKIVFLDYDKSGFYDFVRIGDSIIKEKGNMKIRLIRNDIDTVFTIDYGCKD